jgi:hypothetical protein
VREYATPTAFRLAAAIELPSPFTVEEPNERFGVPERVVYWMVIVLRSTKTLPLLSASEIADQRSVEVGDPSPGMPERV